MQCRGLEVAHTAPENSYSSAGTVLEIIRRYFPSLCETELELLRSVGHEVLPLIKLDLVSPSGMGETPRL